MERQTLAAVALGLLGLSVSGCGVMSSAASATSTPRPLPTPTAMPTPVLSAQVDRAKRIGPGFLDYCPAREGRNPAQFDVMLPGYGPVGGWCQTHARRQPGGDIVAFYAHWDARPIRRGQGTVAFTYAVPRVAGPFSTPIAQLLDQKGQLPP